MDVNEARCERHTRAVDRLMSVAIGAIADNGDPPIVGCDISHERCATMPVIHLGMPENRM